MKRTNIKNFILVSLVALAASAATVHAAFNPPGQAPPSGNVDEPIYTVGSGQSLSGGLTVSSGGLTVSADGFISTVTSGIAIQGSGGATAVYGVQSAGSGANALYGNTGGNNNNYAGRFEGIVNINTLLELSSGAGQGIRFFFQDTGITWPDSTGVELFGIYVKGTNDALRLVGHGGGVEVTDKSLNVRLSVSEAGVVNVASGGSLQVNSVNVCLSDGTNCPPPDLGAAGGWTDDGATVRLTLPGDEVGIGTPSPGAKLQVNPETSQEGVRIVSASNWSPLNIRNSANSADIWRVDQSGSLVVGSIPDARLSANVSLLGQGIGFSEWDQNCANNEIPKRVGGVWQCAADSSGSGTITGSGTTNYMPKWTGSASLGNSTVYDNGNVGIGHASPGYPLHIMDNNSTSIVSVDSNDGVKRWSGFRVARQGSEKWYVGLDDTASESLVFRRAGTTNDVTISSAGVLAAAANITVAGQSVCRADGTNCPAGTTPTLQTVTNAGAVTTLGITAATLNTGPGAYELYAMNQNVQTTDSPTFASPTLSGNLTLQGSVFDATNATALYLNTYGDAQIRIDANNNGTNTFKINNGANSTVFTVDESGNATIAGNATVAGVNVCRADGTNCPAGTTPTLQTVTNAGAVTTLGITAATLNTGPGAYELYAMNQNVQTTDSPTFAALTVTTLNTGQGAYELYAMNQNVRTTDNPTFGALTVTTLNTGQGAYELYAMNQNVQTSDTPTFTGLSANSSRITGVATPSAGTDAANKDYVDTAVASAGGGIDIQRAYCNTAIGSVDEPKSCTASCPAGYGVIDHTVVCVFNASWLAAEGSNPVAGGWACLTLALLDNGANFYAKPPAGQTAYIYGAHITCAKN